MRTGGERDTPARHADIHVVRADAPAPASAAPDAFVDRIGAFDDAHVPERVAAACHAGASRANPEAPLAP